MVFQTEKPEGGTLHYQGYVEFTESIRIVGRTMKNGPWRRFNWTRVDNPRGAIEYARKVRSRVPNSLFGEIGHAAVNRDDNLQDVVDHMAEQDAKIEEILKEHPVMRIKWGERIQTVFIENKNNRTECNVTLLVGPTRCGKSTWVREHLQELGVEYYEVPGKAISSGRWDWAMYRGEDYIIIDEFDDSWLTVTNFKLFFDPFNTYTLEKKGKNMEIKFNHIFLTTNKEPKKWYAKYEREGGDRSAVESRINQFFTIYDCTKNRHWNTNQAQSTQEVYTRYMDMVRRPGNPFRFDSESFNVNRLFN